MKVRTTEVLEVRRVRNAVPVLEQLPAGAIAEATEAEDGLYTLTVDAAEGSDFINDECWNVPPFAFVELTEEELDELFKASHFLEELVDEDRKKISRGPVEVGQYRIDEDRNRGLIIHAVGDLVIVDMGIERDEDDPVLISDLVTMKRENVETWRIWTPPPPLPDIMNAQMVGMGGAAGEIVVVLPKQKMTPDEALVHAGWLVALAGGRQRFLPILDAIEST